MRTPTLLTCLIGALLLAACNKETATKSATPPPSNLVAIIFYDPQTDHLAEIGIVHDGDTYECPPLYECISAPYDFIKNKSLEVIEQDVRDVSRKAHPIAPKTDG